MCTPATTKGFGEAPRSFLSSMFHVEHAASLAAPAAPMTVCRLEGARVRVNVSCGTLSRSGVSGNRSGTEALGGCGLWLFALAS